MVILDMGNKSEIHSRMISGNQSESRDLSVVYESCEFLIFCNDCILLMFVIHRVIGAAEKYETNRSA